MFPKILFLYHHFFGRISGRLPMTGAASCTIEMAECLTQKGFEVTIASILHEEKSYCHNGVRYYHLGSNDEFDRNLSLLGKENFGVVQDLSGRMLQKTAEFFPRAQKIVRLIDAFFGGHEITPEMINNHADNVIAVSSYLQEIAIKWGIKKELITRIPVGIRTDIFRRMPAITREKNLLVFAGATLPEKGIHFLLKGFLGILTPFPDAKLEVYGSAGLWGKKEVIPWQKVEQKFPNILYRGTRPKEELSTALNRSTLCIVPSLIPEGFARASIEAQACGCPVVCNAVGGMPETLINGKTGHLINHISHENLSVALIKLLSDSDRLQAMSVKAAEHAKKYSVENATNAFIKLIA